MDEMLSVSQNLEGQLTATLMATNNDVAGNAEQRLELGVPKFQVARGDGVVGGFSHGIPHAKAQRRKYLKNDSRGSQL